MNLNPNSTSDFRSNDSAETWKVKMQARESEDEMQRLIRHSLLMDPDSKESRCIHPQFSLTFNKNSFCYNSSNDKEFHYFYLLLDKNA